MTHTTTRDSRIKRGAGVWQIPTASVARAGFNLFNRGDFRQDESPLWARRNLNREGQ